MDNLFFWFLNFFSQIFFIENNLLIKNVTYEIFDIKCQSSIHLLKYKQFSEDTLIRCSILCFQEINCKCYTYDKNRRICSFSSQTFNEKCSPNADEILAKPVCT